MSVKIDWSALLLDFLQFAPTVIGDIETDKADASTETKTQLATQALMQASPVAQAIDPNATEEIAAATQVAGGIIQAVKMPSPVAPAA